MAGIFTILMTLYLNIGIEQYFTDNATLGSVPSGDYITYVDLSYESGGDTNPLMLTLFSNLSLFYNHDSLTNYTLGGALTYFRDILTPGSFLQMDVEGGVNFGGYSTYLYLIPSLSSKIYAGSDILVKPYYGIKFLNAENILRYEEHRPSLSILFFLPTATTLKIYGSAKIRHETLYSTDFYTYGRKEGYTLTEADNKTLYRSDFAARIAQNIVRPFGVFAEAGYAYSPESNRISTSSDVPIDAGLFETQYAECGIYGTLGATLILIKGLTVKTAYNLFNKTVRYTDTSGSELSRDDVYTSFSLNILYNFDIGNTEWNLGSRYVFRENRSSVSEYSYRENALSLYLGMGF